MKYKIGTVLMFRRVGKSITYPIIIKHYVGLFDEQNAYTVERVQHLSPYPIIHTAVENQLQTLSKLHKYLYGIEQ